MPAFVFTDAFIEIAGVDLSDHAMRVTVGLPAALVGATRFGHAAEARLQGLRDGDIVVDWQQDFDAAKVDATNWGVYNGAVAVTAKVRAKKGTVIGATNPEYRMNVLMDGYTPLDGSVGELAKITSTYRNADGAAPTRNTA